MPVDLKGRQIQALADALMSAFPSFDHLNTLTLFGLGEPLRQITPEFKPLPAITADLIVWALAGTRLDELIAAALEQSPRSSRLLAVAAELSLTSTARPTERLEKLVTPHIPMPDVMVWRGGMDRRIASVCRIETQAGEALGSGFLIGDRHVLTNFHVAKPGDASPEPLAARFGFWTSTPGGPPSSEEVIDVVRDWRGPSSVVDELDCAVLLLDRAPERPPVGRPPPKDFRAGDIYFVLHHPTGSPQKVSAGIFERYEAATRRVFYRVNTLPGSSGSPVFDMHWRPIALHQGADSDVNTGVPLADILEIDGMAEVWR